MPLSKAAVVTASCRLASKGHSWSSCPAGSGLMLGGWKHVTACCKACGSLLRSCPLNLWRESPTAQPRHQHLCSLPCWYMESSEQCQLQYMQSRAMECPGEEGTIADSKPAQAPCRCSRTRAFSGDIVVGALLLWLFLFEIERGGCSRRR